MKIKKLESISTQFSDTPLQIQPVQIISSRSTLEKNYYEFYIKKHVGSNWEVFTLNTIVMFKI